MRVFSCSSLMKHPGGKYCYPNFRARLCQLPELAPNPEARKLESLDSVPESALNTWAFSHSAKLPNSLSHRGSEFSADN